MWLFLSKILVKNWHLLFAFLIEQYNLKIQELNIQMTKNCEENYLIIHNISQHPPRSTTKYCEQSSLPINITTSGRAVVMEFHHNKSQSEYGFTVSYKSFISKYLNERHIEILL